MDPLVAFASLASDRPIEDRERARAAIDDAPPGTLEEVASELRVRTRSDDPAVRRVAFRTLYAAVDADVTDADALVRTAAAGLTDSDRVARLAATGLLRRWSPSAERLRTSLRADDLDARLAAAGYCAVTDIPDGVWPSLVDCLGVDDARVRRAAVRAVYTEASREDPAREFERAVPRLLDCIDDEQSSVRVHATLAAVDVTFRHGEDDHQRAVLDALAARLRDPDPTVREDVAALFDWDHSPIRNAASAAVADFVLAVATGDGPDPAADAVWALRECAKYAPETVRPVLDDLVAAGWATDDASAIARTLVAVRAEESPGDVAPLLDQIIAGAQAGVGRADAVDVLDAVVGADGDAVGDPEEVVGVLASVLAVAEEPPDEQAAAAARTLGRLAREHPDAVAPTVEEATAVLSAHLAVPADRYRREAARGLAAFGRSFPEAAPPAATALAGAFDAAGDDPLATLARAAPTVAADRVADIVAALDSDADSMDNYRRTDCLVAMAEADPAVGTDVVPELADALFWLNTSARERAARTIAAVARSDPETVAPYAGELTGFLSDSSAAVRDACADALCLVGRADASALPPVLEPLSEIDPETERPMTEIARVAPQLTERAIETVLFTPIPADGGEIGELLADVAAADPTLVESPVRELQLRLERVRGARTAEAVLATLAERHPTVVVPALDALVERAIDADGVSGHRTFEALAALAEVEPHRVWAAVRSATDPAELTECAPHRASDAVEQLIERAALRAPRPDGETVEADDTDYDVLHRPRE